MCTVHTLTAAFFVNSMHIQKVYSYSCMQERTEIHFVTKVCNFGNPRSESEAGSSMASL